MNTTAKYRVGEFVVFNFVKGNEKHQITACQLRENGFNYQVNGKWWAESSIEPPTVYPGDIDYEVWKVNQHLANHNKPYRFEVSWKGSECNLYLSTPENARNGLWGSYLMSGTNSEIKNYLETYKIHE